MSCCVAIIRHVYGEEVDCDVIGPFATWDEAEKCAERLNDNFWAWGMRRCYSAEPIEMQSEGEMLTDLRTSCG